VAARPLRSEARGRPALAGARAPALALDARLAGRLLRREKRFLADVALDDGRVVRAHCPDPGRMEGLAVPGAAVRLAPAAGPGRRLAFRLELVRDGRTWVGVHPARANALAALALDAGALRGLGGYRERRREAAAPGGCRLDFRLAGHPRDRRPCWLEVKSATLAEGGVARFPDSPSERGRRHVETLAALARRGARAVLLFVVQRDDCCRVEPADAIDPHFAAALRAAARAGLELRALAVHASPRALRLAGPLPVRL